MDFRTCFALAGSADAGVGKAAMTVKEMTAQAVAVDSRRAVLGDVCLPMWIAPRRFLPIARNATRRSDTGYVTRGKCLSNRTKSKGNTRYGCERA